MHFTTLLLPLAVSASSIFERQAPPAGGASTGAKVAGIDNVEPQYRKTAKRTITKFGPYTIRGASATAGGAKGGKSGGGGMPGGGMGMGMGDSTSMGQSFFLSVRNGMCNELAKGPCTILAGRVGVMWIDGKKADPSNGIYIHHILSSDNTKKETPWFSACNAPTRAGMSISAMTGGTGFLGTGEDGSDAMTIYTSNDGTRDSGYHVGEKDVFTIWAQLVNYNKDPAKVYIFYDTEWIPGTVGDNVKGVTVSATCGAGGIKMSPSGPTNTTSGKFYIMEDGRILGSRGHLHDGGVAMDLFVNGKFICKSEAEYGTRAEGGAGHGHGDSQAGIKTISNMSTCKGPWPVKKGDYVTLTAEYDLKKHPLRKTAEGHDVGGSMGMMGISFASGSAPPKSSSKYNATEFSDFSS